MKNILLRFHTMPTLMSEITHRFKGQPFVVETESTEIKSAGAFPPPRRKKHLILCVYSFPFLWYTASTRYGLHCQ